MRPNSRQSLIDYCLSQLGAPVLEVNVEDTQLDNAVDDALQFYQEFHSDAVIRYYRKHQVTATDVTNQFITLPESMLFVTRILPVSLSNTNSNSLFSINYQIALNTVNDLYRNLDLVTYEMTRQHMNMIDMTFNGLDQISTYNRHMNRLYIRTEWGKKIQVGDFIIIEGYEIVDPDTHTKVYNDLYLKRYLTAKIKKQWATNLKKFEGVQLPGGVTINAQTMFDEANSEIAELEEEMELKWSMPPVFFVG